MTGLNEKQLEMLKDPFPAEALGTDNSRGFELTSIKAAYVMERLNDVFGICGYGWRYAHAPFDIETAGGKDEVMTEIALQYRVGEDGRGPVDWLNGQGWDYANHSPVWSEPIFYAGGKRVDKGRFTDARKSAITDGLTKSASVLGIGHSVFKGQESENQRQPSPAQQQRQRATQQPPVKKQAADPAKAALYATKKGKKLGTCTPEQLQVIIKADDISGELQQAATTLFNFISEKVGATDLEATYNSITGTQG